MEITVNSPGSRSRHGFVYDSGNNKAYLFSGWNYPYFYNDLWEYDVIAHTWSEVNIIGTKPEGRLWPRLVIWNNKVFYSGTFA